MLDLLHIKYLDNKNKTPYNNVNRIYRVTFLYNTIKLLSITISDFCRVEGINDIVLVKSHTFVFLNSTYSHKINIEQQ